MTNCPRCHGAVATGQEYCLECGLRLPGEGRLGAAPVDRRRFAVSLLVAAGVAAAGAAVAIGLTREPASAVTISVATGGSEVVSQPTTPSTELMLWPDGTSAWTNVLVSVPKVDGRDDAVARADEARRRGLHRVGVLDSSRYASLHPGYWVVFAGVYPSEPEAASNLRAAKAIQKTARTQRVSG